MVKMRPLAYALKKPMLEEVIVTAQKRSESLQDVPVAVTAFNADTIQEAGINNANDLAIMTPSLHSLSLNSPFNTKLQVRGVGTAQSDPALEPSVGVFVDGVFLGRSGLGMSDLTDIERIEVLQGPQGTLYGKNTNAGAISVITIDGGSSSLGRHCLLKISGNGKFRGNDRFCGYRSQQNTPRSCFRDFF